MVSPTSINEEEHPWYDQVFAVLDEKLEPILPEGWSLKSILMLIGFGWTLRVRAAYLEFRQYTTVSFTQLTFRSSACLPSSLAAQLMRGKMQRMGIIKSRFKKR